MESITVKKVSSAGRRLDIDFDVSNGLKKFFSPEHHFFVEFTCDISDVPASVLIVPFLTNVLQLSWLTNSVIWVDEIDSVFYKNLYRLKTAFGELYPYYKFGGTLIAARQIDNHYDIQREAVLLFTGGIDATASLIRHEHLSPILLNTNGWYCKNSDECNPVYDADFEAISRIAHTHDLHSIFVKSNFATFINGNKVNEVFGKIVNNTWWFGFQHSPAFLGCAIVAGYHFRVRKIYIASSYTFGQNVVCVSDPRIDSCISCSEMTTVHDGYELSRQDKVKLITAYQAGTAKKAELRVCSFNTHNCCCCEKCFRSMLALIAEGVDKLEQFGFDLDEPILDKTRYFIEYKAMELDHNHVVFWQDIVRRMGDNYQNLVHKEVYDYLKNIDLDHAKRRSILHHYKADYKDILKRKLTRLFNRGN